MTTFKVSTVYEQGSGRLNEDRLLTRDARFAVFDGASAVEESPYISPDGATGGFLAADIACAAFLDSSASLLACTRAANENLAVAMRQAGVDPARKRSAWCGLRSS
jgi:hypothetical protein